MYLLLCRSGLCLQWYWLLGVRTLCEKVNREVREQKNVKYKKSLKLIPNPQLLADLHKVGQHDNWMRKGLWVH